jgi:hypothetical protein
MSFWVALNSVPLSAGGKPFYQEVVTPPATGATRPSPVQVHSPLIPLKALLSRASQHHPKSKVNVLQKGADAEAHAFG